MVLMIYGDYYSLRKILKIKTEVKNHVCSKIIVLLNNYDNNCCCTN